RPSTTCSTRRRRNCSHWRPTSPRCSWSPCSSRTRSSMDNFGNYPRERPFDPFSVMLFKGLQVVAFLFFLALLAMNPEAKEGKTEPRAEFLISMTGPDDPPDDIDLYAEDPLGNIVWYHQREGGFMVLDRDDRGSANNSITVDGRKISSPIRQETISIRG